MPVASRPSLLRLAALACLLVLLALVGSLSGANPSDAGLGGANNIVVTTTLDESGGQPAACSLREAIEAANQNHSFFGGCSRQVKNAPDVITFNLPNPSTLSLPNVLPPITAPVEIDGSLLGGGRVQLLGDGDLFDDGLDVRAANVTIGSIAIGGFGNNAIYANTGANNTIIRGNFIGTDATGTVATPNGTGIASVGGTIAIGGTSGWTPGSSCTGNCNLISGNDMAVFIHSLTSGNVLIFGNMIGTDVTGTAAIPNDISLRAQASVFVGDDEDGAGNLISGNEDCGAIIEAGDQSFVAGNYFGTDTTGMLSLPNGCGLRVDDATSATIGGVVDAARNVFADDLAITISRSESPVIEGNYIGTAADGITPLDPPPPNSGFAAIFIDATNGAAVGRPAVGNIIANHEVGVHFSSTNGNGTGNFARGNSIYGNASKGIRLSDGQPPTLPVNGGIQPPVITGLGSLHGIACPNCEVDVYSDDEDEGRIYEGTVTADGLGNWTYNGTLTGPFVTATANDLAKGTSEFSAPFDPTPPTPTPSPSPTPSPTLTASPTPTAGPTQLQGDADCDGDVDEDDVFAILHSASGIEGFGACATAASVRPEGVETRDVNCDLAIDGLDALHVLLHLAGLPELDKPQGCALVAAPIG